MVLSEAIFDSKWAKNAVIRDNAEGGLGDLTPTPNVCKPLQPPAPTKKNNKFIWGKKTHTQQKLTTQIQLQNQPTDAPHWPLFSCSSQSDQPSWTVLFKTQVLLFSFKVRSELSSTLLQPILLSRNNNFLLLCMRQEVLREWGHASPGRVEPGPRLVLGAGSGKFLHLPLPPLSHPESWGY